MSESKAGEQSSAAREEIIAHKDPQAETKSVDWLTRVRETQTRIAKLRKATDCLKKGKRTTIEQSEQLAVEYSEVVGWIEEISQDGAEFSKNTVALRELYPDYRNLFSEYFASSDQKELIPLLNIEFSKEEQVAAKEFEDKIAELQGESGKKIREEVLRGISTSGYGNYGTETLAALKENLADGNFTDRMKLATVILGIMRDRRGNYTPRILGEEIRKNLLQGENRLFNTSEDVTTNVTNVLLQLDMLGKKRPDLALVQREIIRDGEDSRISLTNLGQTCSRAWTQEVTRRRKGVSVSLVKLFDIAKSVR